MSEPVVAGARRSAGGLLPLLVTVVGVVVLTVWLVVHDSRSPTLGYVGGPLTMAAAAWSLRDLGTVASLPPAVRAFWRQLAHAAYILLVGAAVAVVTARPTTGMSPLVAVPTLVGMCWAMAAFLRLPLDTHTPLRWARMLLDLATFAVAGTVVFTYAVLSLAADGTTSSAVTTAGVVGVAGLLALVVLGRVAASSENQVDVRALRILAVAPILAVALAALLIIGDYSLRLAGSVLCSPLVAFAFAAAARRQHTVLAAPEVAEARPRRAIYEFLPYLAIAVTAGLVLIVSARQMDGRNQLVIAGAVLIAAFVMGRQLLGLRENQSLLDGIRSQQAELERLALTDPLTGLANRNRFVAELADRLGNHRPATVLMIDIDDFKMVNDTMGPALGDELLTLVADRLRRHSRAHELPARLGGDEFAVLLDVDDPGHAEEAATRIQQLLAEPFRAGESDLLTQASIGIAVAGRDEIADEVMRNADIAMYAAKDTGKAAWMQFEPRMRRDVVNHARLGSELRTAILRGELFLLYQPVFDIVTGRLHGAEALVRWNHPDRGLVPPIDFIPVAERSGLIVPLGTWVLREACRQLAAWRREHHEGAIRAINVNVAVRQLREAGFVDEVAAALSDHGLLPGNLILEVTESSVADGRQVRETLTALHDMGVRLALDDFGTGQSSLSLLRAFPVDVLKLDKSFVDGIVDGTADGEDRGRLAVAAAVAQLAEYLQLSAVAEGIESEAQLNRLRGMGYRLGQGFYMSRPLPALEAGKLMGTTTTVLGAA